MIIKLKRRSLCEAGNTIFAPGITGISETELEFYGYSHRDNTIQILTFFFLPWKPMILLVFEILQVL